MNIATESLERFFQNWALSCAVVVELSTGTIERIGGPFSGQFQDLEEVLFRDRDTLMSLLRSLEGQVLPRIWSQGRVSCLVCKPATDYLVGIFDEDGDRDPAQKYVRSKDINAALMELFA